MKTLYIADLDGTLLSPDVTITDFTSETINRLIGEGMYFSIATARTSATVIRMLRDININTPVVLMNGVCILDLQSEKYVSINPIKNEAKKQIFDILAENGLPGFWYSIKDDKLNTFYEFADTPQVIEFIDERVRKYGKKFTKLDSIYECIDEPLIYYSIVDKEERLHRAAEALKKVDGIRIEYYLDIYGENSWYLEICSEKASKSEAVKFLRKNYGFDRVIGFGDNLNDLPLFAECDESCAMLNARDVIKEKATRVIGSNGDDGVAVWLDNNFR